MLAELEYEEWLFRVNRMLIRATGAQVVSHRQLPFFDWLAAFEADREPAEVVPEALETRIDDPKDALSAALYLVLTASDKDQEARAVVLVESIIVEFEIADADVERAQFEATMLHRLEG